MYCALIFRISVRGLAQQCILLKHLIVVDAFQSIYLQDGNAMGPISTNRRHFQLSLLNRQKQPTEISCKVFNGSSSRHGKKEQAIPQGALVGASRKKIESAQKTGTERKGNVSTCLCLSFLLCSWAPSIFLFWTKRFCPITPYLATGSHIS